MSRTTRYSLKLDDYLAAQPGDYLPHYDTGLERRGSEWGQPGVHWLPVEMPALLSGSDYDGGSYTVSNHRVFTAHYGDIPGVWQYSGGYGGYGIFLTPWALAWVIDGDPVADYGEDSAGDPYRLRSTIKTLRDILAELDDYPILDDDDHSDVEMDAENAAWESWVWREYREALVKRYPWLDDIYTADERTAGIVDSSRPDNASRELPTLWESFRRAMERDNCYWENETGNSATVDVDRVAAATTVNDLAESGIVPSVAGTVSHGTMRAVDLIPAFLATLESVIDPDDDDGKEGTAALQASYARLRATCDWESSEHCDWLLAQLLDALNTRAPAGYYFGSHPGDATDYGYWPAEGDLTP